MKKIQITSLIFSSDFISLLVMFDKGEIEFKYNLVSLK